MSERARQIAHADLSVLFAVAQLIELQFVGSVAEHAVKQIDGGKRSARTA